MNYAGASLAALGPYQRYLSRALTEGRAEPVFDAMVQMSEQWLAELDQRRADPPFADRKARATVGTAMALAVGSCTSTCPEGWASRCPPRRAPTCSP